MTHDYCLLTGDIMTFHLSRLLGMDNVPFLGVVVVNSTDRKWAAVAESITDAGWVDGEFVTLAQWMENLDQHPL